MHLVMQIGEETKIILLQQAHTSFIWQKNLISWSSKKYRTIARSSTEAEYMSIANTTAKINWICSPLSELHVKLPTRPVIYCDNIGTTQLFSNPIFHSRMKHVAIDFHFIRDQVENGALRVSDVSSNLLSC